MMTCNDILHIRMMIMKLSHRMMIMKLSHKNDDHETIT